MLKAFLIPLLYLSSVIALLIIDHFWNDKKTNKYKKARLIFIIICFISAITNGYFIYNEKEQAVEDKEKLTEKFKNDSIHMQSQFEASRIDIHESFEKDSLYSELRYQKAVIQRDSLSIKLNKLENIIRPFIEIAHIEYPNLDIKIALSKMAERVKNLESFSKREEFKNINPELKRKTIKKLKELNKTLNNPFDIITFQILANNKNRLLVAEQLVDIFVKAGFNTKPLVQIFPSGQNTGIGIACTQEKYNEMQLLLDPLESIFGNANKYYLSTTDVKNNELLIIIDGEFIFFENGKVGSK